MRQRQLYEPISKIEGADMRREQDSHGHAHDAHGHGEHEHDEHEHDEHGHDEHEHDEHEHDEHDDHGHSHGEHDHGEHGHSHDTGLWGMLNTVFHMHGHSDQQQQLAADPAMATDEGIREIWMARAALGITTVLQVGIVWLSGSVALLADTVHNLGDALNSIPLLIAFYLARRAATRRYTYGFGKAEDVAGLFIVLSIAFDAGTIFWDCVMECVHPG